MTAAHVVTNKDTGVIIAVFESATDALKCKHDFESKSKEAYIKAGQPEYYTTFQYRIVTVPYYPRKSK